MDDLQEEFRRKTTSTFSQRQMALVLTKGSFMQNLSTLFVDSLKLVLWETFKVSEKDCGKIFFCFVCLLSSKYNNFLFAFYHSETVNGGSIVSSMDSRIRAHLVCV